MNTAAARIRALADREAGDLPPTLPKGPSCTLVKDHDGPHSDVRTGSAWSNPERPGDYPPRLWPNADDPALACAAPPPKEPA
jgi:hypothetical protein